MLIRSFLAILGLVFAGHGAALAAVHNLSYAKKAPPLGTELTLAGKTYVLVRIPIELFTGEKYSLIMPFERYRDDPTDGTLNLTTEHSIDAFDANLAVDSYPARVLVDDLRNSTVSGDYGVSSSFTVSTQVTLTVTIKVGTTLVSVQYSMDRGGYDTDATLGTSFNAQPSAEWGKYTDPTGIVTAMDDLIDYVRVVPL
jgi:autotransporter translocation and assembly factor TamB